MTRNVENAISALLEIWCKAGPEMLRKNMCSVKLNTLYNKHGFTM